MKAPLLIITLTLVLITSGCVRETGDVVIKFTDLNISGQEAGLNLSGLEEPSEAPEAAGNATGGEVDPCASVVCDDSITTCPDGTVMACGNTCDLETGNCTTCTPDCTGYEAPEECGLECGTCEALDEEACECITILYCDGNGICEPSYNESYEWLYGQDCLPFEGCDDGDECTQDIFDPNYQICTHVDICCDDSDECTVDYYNYTTDICEYTYICCSGAEAIIQGAEYNPDTQTLELYVNNAGDMDLTFDVYLTLENGSVEKPEGEWEAAADELATFSIGGVSDTLTEAMIQSNECEEARDFIGRSWINGLEAGEEPGDVNIIHINETEEIVHMDGYNVDMTGWTLEDIGPNFIYQFPDGFIIDGRVYLHRGYGNDTETDLYWQDSRYVWNDDGDTATLRNEPGEAVSTYEY